MRYLVLGDKFWRVEEKRGLSPLHNVLVGDAGLLQSSFSDFVKPTSRLWQVFSDCILEWSRSRIEARTPYHIRVATRRPIVGPHRAT